MGIFHGHVCLPRGKQSRVSFGNVAETVRGDYNASALVMAPMFHTMFFVRSDTLPGKHTKKYICKIAMEIVDLPIKNGGFP